AKRAFGFLAFVFDLEKAAPGRLLRDVPACTGCHGADPRPNFRTYFHWVGMIGSIDDFLSAKKDGHRYTETGFRFEEELVNGYAPDQRERVIAEHAAIDGNFGAWKSHPRYGRLSDIRSHAEPKAYASDHFTARPNFYQQENILRLNMQRVTRLVEATPDYPV